MSLVVFRGVKVFLVTLLCVQYALSSAILSTEKRVYRQTGNDDQGESIHTEDDESNSCQMEAIRGRDGRDGRDGVMGLKGEKGEQGVVGPQGEMGEQGDKGEQGESGPQGLSGGAGDKGDIGLPGDRGIKGDHGIIGEKGEVGERGPVGLSGPRGAVGKKGDSGNKGDRGDQGFPGPQGLSSFSGGLYTRWGRTNCSSIHGTELVYSGIAGGSGYGTDTLCFPHVPEYSSSSAVGMDIVHGIEYFSHPAGFQYENVPCAVCFTSLRSTIMMIPAKLTCPTEWVTEYTGYLMTDSAHGNTMHVCVDQSPESIPGFAGDGNSYEWITINSRCSDSGLPCPPYSTANRPLTCVVCSH